MRPPLYTDCTQSTIKLLCNVSQMSNNYRYNKKKICGPQWHHSNAITSKGLSKVCVGKLYKYRCHNNTTRVRAQCTHTLKIKRNKNECMHVPASIQTMLTYKY